MDVLLPLIAGIIGAGVGWWAKQSELRHAAKIVAGDTLAELYSHLWPDTDWLQARVYLTRLQFRLRAAGVPAKVALWVRDAAFSVHGFHQEHPDRADYHEAANDADYQLWAATEAASLWLFHGWWHQLRRYQARTDAPAE